MNWKLQTAICAAALVASGCAGTPDTVLDAKALTGAHSAVVVGPDDPVSIAVDTQADANARAAMAAAAAIPFAGVLGAAVAGGVAGAIVAEIHKETTQPLLDAAQAEKYQLGSAMKDALVTALQSDGYNASAGQIVRKSVTDFPANYDSLKGQTDLVVDVAASAMCTDIDSGKSSHFRPVVRMTVILAHPGDKKVLMRKSFVYDDAAAKPDAYNIKGDPQFDIPDYKALKANIGECLKGIKSGVTPLAQALAAVLHQP